MGNFSRPLYFFGTSSGGQTLDSSGSEMGNPFATSFIQLMGSRSLTLGNFGSELQRLTLEASKDFQRPEIPELVATETEFTLFPRQESYRYTALVIVYADYHKGGANSLPGAHYDAIRVSTALLRAGFDVQTVIDPTLDVFNSTLDEFRQRTMASDVAIIYSTGHGIEVNDTIYLLPGSYPIAQGNYVLRDEAIQVSGYSRVAVAKQLNLILFAGCRNNPLA